MCELTLIERATTRRRPVGGEWAIHVRGWSQPLSGRYGTSDIDVFRQIFIEEEHAWIRTAECIRPDPLILDCGANVGYATIYFLRLFPQACVIAVEPDEDNFHLLVKNVANAGGRVRAMKAGLWSHETTLTMETRKFRDGKEWSRQVQEQASVGESRLPAVTVSQLMELAGRTRIDLLKIDIEGAETVVLADGGRGWLDRTDYIAIELHDDTHFGPATPVFVKTVPAEQFDFSKSGELTIAARRNRQ